MTASIRSDTPPRNSGTSHDGRRVASGRKPGQSQTTARSNHTSRRTNVTATSTHSQVSESSKNSLKRSTHGTTCDTNSQRRIRLATANTAMTTREVRSRSKKAGSNTTEEQPGPTLEGTESRSPPSVPISTNPFGSSRPRPALVRIAELIVRIIGFTDADSRRCRARCPRASIPSRGPDRRERTARRADGGRIPRGPRSPRSPSRAAE